MLSDPDAEEWFFEENTEAIIGTGDYVISQKRKAYSELEQDQVVGLVASLQNEISDLKSENMELVRDVNSLKDEVQTVSASMVSLKATANSNSGTNSAADGFFEDFSGEGSFGEDEETALKAALALSIISFALWMLALVFIFAKFVFKEPVHAEQMLIFWVFAYLLNEDGLKPFHLALEELEHLSTLVLGLLHQGTVI